MEWDLEGKQGMFFVLFLFVCLSQRIDVRPLNPGLELLQLTLSGMNLGVPIGS